MLDKTRILHDNLILQQQLETEKNSRLKIEQKLAPRDLNAAVQTQMISTFRPMLPQDIDIVLYAGNPESEHLAQEIKWAFQQINWKFYIYQPMGGSLQGIRIEYDGQDKAAATVATMLATLFASSGIQVTAVSPNLPPISQEIGVYTSNGTSGSTKVRIFVGSK